MKSDGERAFLANIEMIDRENQRVRARRIADGNRSMKKRLAAALLEKGILKL